MSVEDQKRALIVSISEYDSFENLPFCLNDGKEMCKLLKQKLAYEVTDNNKLVGKVQYENMKNVLVKFFADPNNKPEDTLVFYFSGHGALDNNGNSYFASSETDPSRPYINGISFDFLSLLASDCQSSKIVMMLDCCYSGKATFGIGKGGADEEEAVKLGKAAIEDKIKEGHGMYLLASSQGYQKSYPMPDKSYSVFTYLVIQGLQGHKLSVDSDGYVTPESLDKFIHYKISQMPETVQKPIRKVQASGDIRLAYHPRFALLKNRSSHELVSLVELLNYDDPYLNRGQYEKSISIFEKILKVNSNVAPLWYRKGRLLVRLSKQPEALQCFDKALEIDPQYVDAWCFKGHVLNVLRRQPEALQCFDKALEIDPRHADAWCFKGILLRDSKEYDKALQWFDKALEIDPRHADAWYNKGLCFVDKFSKIDRNHPYGWFGKKSRGIFR